MTETPLVTLTHLKIALAVTLCISGGHPLPAQNSTPPVAKETDADPPPKLIGMGATGPLLTYPITEK